MAPVTTIGLGSRWSRSRKNAVSSIASVPWTTTAPSIASSARASRTLPASPNSASNVKWLAGVRPRSIATRSAIRSRPGAVARSASPPRTGTLPPAAGSWRMLIVPPVKTIATRATGSALDPWLVAVRLRELDHLGDLRRRLGGGHRIDRRPDDQRSLRRARAVELAGPVELAEAGDRLASHLGVARSRLHTQGGDERVAVAPDGRPRVALHGPERPAQVDRGDARRGDQGRDEDQDDRRTEKVRDRADDEDRQEARDRNEHVQDPEDPAADVLGQVLLELGLGRDRDRGVRDAGEKRDADHDRGERRQDGQGRRTGRGRRAGERRV